MPPPRRPEPPAALPPLPIPARALLRGSRVERFEIVRVIADAASGIEYIAIDPSDPREVVLREYMPQRLGRRGSNNLLRPLTPSAAVSLAAGLQAFTDEGRMLAGIDHPALVRVLGMIEANATAYMVTPLYDGVRLLQARQAMRVPPDERLLRPLLHALLDALEAMHGASVLHGAVSPNNILLLSDERPLLLGPDLARNAIADDLVESLMISVQPSFEAPEQRSPSGSRPRGPWSDLYGLAETLRYCISGELRPPPVPAGAPRETMAAMVRRLFGAPPTALYSAALLETIDAALDPRPAPRPQSTAQFRALMGYLPPDVAEPESPAGHDLAASRMAEPPRATSTLAPPALLNALQPTVQPDPQSTLPPVAASPLRVGAPAMPPAPSAAPQPTPLPPFFPPPPPEIDQHGAPTPDRIEPGFEWLRGAHADARPDPHATERRTAGRPPERRSGGTWIVALGAAALFTAGGLWGGWWRGQAPAPAPAPITAPADPPRASPDTAAAAAATVPTTVTAPVPAPAPSRIVTAPPSAAPKPAVPPANAAPRQQPAPAGLASPRDACAGRTQFALYRCMQTQCEQRAWTHHPQCDLLRATDRVE